MLWLLSIAFAGVCTEFNGDLDPGAWSATPTADGNASVDLAASSGSQVVFAYDRPPEDWWGTGDQTAVYSVVVPADGTLSFDWVYAYDHGVWFPGAWLEVHVGGDEDTLHYDSSFDFYFSYQYVTGSYTTSVSAGDIVEVRATSYNGDGAADLTGTITLSNLAYDSDEGCCGTVIGDSVDVDGDGFGACDGDCNDADASVFPGQPEVACNGLDDDCDPATPDGYDGDGDGFAACGGDCNDGDVTVYPGAPEIDCNGVDDDCDPSTLDGPDDDGDGVPVCTDCDDGDGSIAPGLPEVSCNGIDDDCDPITLDVADDDLDGISVCDGDCDDQDPTVGPGAVEVACNGIDDDCDPTTIDALDDDGDGVDACTDCDDNDPTASETVVAYADIDQDGYGVGNPVEFCGQPPSTALLDGDCDSQDPTVYPGADEIPDDGIDQDCDGEDLTDLDGDGASVADGDCDDNDPQKYPGANDKPDDGIDQDCSGHDVQLTVGGAAGWRCGCSATSPAGGALGMIVGLLAVGRRRR